MWSVLAPAGYAEVFAGYACGPSGATPPPAANTAAPWACPSACPRAYGPGPLSGPGATSQREKQQGQVNRASYRPDLHFPVGARPTARASGAALLAAKSPRQVVPATGGWRSGGHLQPFTPPPIEHLCRRCSLPHQEIPPPLPYQRTLKRAPGPTAAPYGPPGVNLPQKYRRQTETALRIALWRSGAGPLRV